MQRNEKNSAPNPASMTLDNFQLPPFLTGELYKDSLVDLDSKQLKNKSLKEEGFAFLGNNSKNILVIVNDENAVNLADEDLGFLIDILTACKLSLSDIALINHHRNPGLSYKTLVPYFKPETILCLGVTLDSLAFPLEFPDYQVQKYNNQSCLCAPSLKKLAANKEEKLKLWGCLKKIFAI
jgi:hypothetical protein